MEVGPNLPSLSFRWPGNPPQHMNRNSSHLPILHSEARVGRVWYIWQSVSPCRYLTCLRSHLLLPSSCSDISGGRYSLSSSQLVSCLYQSALKLPWYQCLILEGDSAKSWTPLILLSQGRWLKEKTVSYLLSNHDWSHAESMKVLTLRPLPTKSNLDVRGSWCKVTTPSISLIRVSELKEKQSVLSVIYTWLISC